MTRISIVAARRTAVVPRNKAFIDQELYALAKPVIDQCLVDCGLSHTDVDEVIVSNALGAGGNPARSISLHCGFDDAIPGLTIDRQCAGGLDALLLAQGLIASGQAKTVVVGGVESYSRRPTRARTFSDGRPPKSYDQARFTPWDDCDPDMHTAAGALADLYGITKQDQDDWAIRSHAKAINATSRLAAEITPLNGVLGDPYARHLTRPVCARAQALSRSVTSANTSVAADAAAFCVLTSEPTHTAQSNCHITLEAGLTLGAAPDLPGIAPIKAVDRLLAEQGLTVNDLDCIELMEAYAVQAIACYQGNSLPLDKINLGGGSLARGHPIGASGTILAVRLFHELQRTGGLGLATIASAGGLGTAVILKCA